MKNLNLVEIKAFVPAKDFEGAIFLPKKSGLKWCLIFMLAYFTLGSCASMLQDVYQPQHSSNFMMHLLA